MSAETTAQRAGTSTSAVKVRAHRGYKVLPQLVWLRDGAVRLIVLR